MTGVMARSQMAGINDDEASTRAISSMQMAQVTWSAAEPPQSSGKVRPMRPMALKASWACQGYWAFSSHSAAWGATLSSHIWRTARRNSSCSSVVRNIGGNSSLVRLGETEGVLRHEVQHHLAADGGGAEEAGQAVERGQAVLGGQAVAAVRLDGLVEGLERRLGRGVLGHVGGLAGVSALVVEPGGLERHEPCLLDLDLGDGQRVGEPLVHADGDAPHLALQGVVGRLAQGVAG